MGAAPCIYLRTTANTICEYYRKLLSYQESYAVIYLKWHTVNKNYWRRHFCLRFTVFTKIRDPIGESLTFNCNLTKSYYVLPNNWRANVIYAVYSFREFNRDILTMSCTFRSICTLCMIFAHSYYILPTCCLLYLHISPENALTLFKCPSAKK